ncbi:hypothetical protein [Clostridium oryzae]|nr:hypothetical protein [Clostridium oryzae]
MNNVQAFIDLYCYDDHVFEGDRPKKLIKSFCDECRFIMEASSGEKLKK